MLREEKPREKWAEVWRPRRNAVVVTLICALFLLWGWTRVSQHAKETLMADQRTQVNTELSIRGRALEAATNQRMAFLSGLEAFVQAHLQSGTLDELPDDFEAFVIGLVTATGGVRNVSIAPAGVQTWVYPLEGNENVPGHDLLNDERPNVRADVQRTIETGQIALSGPYDLRQGGLGLVARLAVFQDGEFWGLVTMVLDVPPLLTEAGLDRGTGGLSIALRDTESEVFFGDATVFDQTPISYLILLPEGSWELAAAPQGGWDESIQDSMTMVNGVSLAIAVLLIALVYLLANQQARLSAAVQQRTTELAAEIDERRRAEVALRTSEQQARVLAAILPVGINRGDPDGNVTYANQKVLDMTGVSMGEALDGSWVDRLHPDDRERVMQSWLEALKAGQTYQSEHRFVHSDGSETWVLFQGLPEVNDRGKVEGFVGTAVDITERKVAETALNRRMEQLTALSHASQFVTASLELDQVLSVIVSLTGEVTNSDYTSVALIDETGSVYQSIGNMPAVPAVEDRIRDEGLTRWVLRTRSPVLVHDISAEGAMVANLGKGAPRFANPHIVDAGIRSVAGLPLIVRDELLGVIFLHSLTPNVFNGQISILQAFANQAAIAVENARLFEAAQQEIRERAKAEEALRYQAYLLENISDAIISGNLDFNILNWNRAAEATYGWTAEEAMGKSFQELIKPDYSPLGRDEVVERFLSEGNWQGVVIHHHRDGTPLFVSSLVTLLRDEKGNPVGVVAANRDITEQVKAENALRESEERFRSLTNLAPVGVYLTDRAGQSQYVNERWLQMTGLTFESALGEGWVQAIHPDDRNGVLASWHEMVSAGRDQWQYEYRFQTPAGEVLWVLGLATTLRDSDGQVEGYIGIDMDITERVEAEQTLKEHHLHLEQTLAELRETQEKLVRQERMAAVGQLAAGIAHDFNNVMASIILFSDLMLTMSKLAPGDRDKVAAIRQQGQHAAELTQQILDFSRKAVLQRQNVDLDAFLTEIQALLARTLPESIRLHFKLGAQSAAVSADPTRLQQAIMNLAINARDAMLPRGGGNLSIELGVVGDGTLPLADMKAGQWAQIRVRDDGAGISADILPHIFEPFFTTKAPLGSGLGLAQVYGIVTQHQGFVDVDSEEGQGATFSIYLPIVPPKEAEASADPISTLPMGQGELVLVVEDEAAVQDALMESLRTLNYLPVLAANGRQALELYEQHRDEIALVLSDLVMPEMGGMALAKSLRERYENVRMVVLTGYGFSSHHNQELEGVGVVGWLQKPIDLHQLAQVVDRAMSIEEAV